MRQVRGRNPAGTDCAAFNFVDVIGHCEVGRRRHPSSLRAPPSQRSGLRKAGIRATAQPTFNQSLPPYQTGASASNGWRVDSDESAAVGVVIFGIGPRSPLIAQQHSCAADKPVIDDRVGASDRPPGGDAPRHSALRLSARSRRSRAFTPQGAGGVPPQTTGISSPASYCSLAICSIVARCSIKVAAMSFGSAAPAMARRRRADHSTPQTTWSLPLNIANRTASGLASSTRRMDQGKGARETPFQLRAQQTLDWPD